MNTCIVFFTILWITAFGYAPWEQDKKGVRSLSVCLIGLLLAMIGFVILYYPHIAYQFYPPQIFMAAPPWWSETAMTRSSLFHFGWMVPALVLLYWTTMLWEGGPFRNVENRWWRGILTTVMVVVLGLAILFAANKGMDWYWGVEACEGGNTIEQPAWRWNHVAELALMMALAGAIWFHYFDNWPKTVRSLFVRACIRTVIAAGGGLGIAAAYWEYNDVFLGLVYGLGQENDTSNAWTVMNLVLLNLHMLCLDGWPLRRLVR
jgi:AAT family amino acid transporter